MFPGLLTRPMSCRAGLARTIAICCLQHPTADPCLWLLFQSPRFLPLARTLAALQRMFRREAQVRITLRLRAPGLSASAPPVHVVSVRLEDARQRKPSRSSGLIDSASQAAAVPGIKLLSPGSGGRAAKPFLSGRRAFPFPWLQVLLLFSPASAVAPAASSREAQLPQQVWSH